jgi:hypothetical protein
MARKTPQMDNNAFLSDAENIITNVAGNNVQLHVKQFKTGSVGWSYNGPLQVQVGKNLVKVQANINLTLVGSKPEEAAEKDAA